MWRGRGGESVAGFSEYQQEATAHGDDKRRFESSNLYLLCFIKDVDGA